jgi:glycine hydroxymethyltransferase
VFDDVRKTVENHERWRSECLNMIASEGVMSPAAKKFYVSDFEGRYNEHTGPDCHYRGTKYSYEIEEICNELFREKFNTRFADVRPIAGGIANLTAYAAFSKPGDIIVSPGIPNGAHVSHTRYGLAGVRGLKNIDMFFDKERMNIDVEKTVELIEKVKPKLVMVGASMFLFPHPIRAIKDAMSEDAKLIYDSAHVFGLVYNKKFQKPLEEGADLITSSTHKTFQGPQGGVIIGKKDTEEKDWKKVENALFPGITSNTHIHRFPSLAITAMEMDEFGEAYANQVISNAKALAKEMNTLGFDVLCPNLNFTESHQVIFNVKKLGGGKTVAETLECCNIICNKMSLPNDTPDDATKNPSGIRLGVQELTRFGMKEKEMKFVAELFKKILIDKTSVDKMKKDVTDFRKQFTEIGYCFKD